MRDNINMNRQVIISHLLLIPHVPGVSHLHVNRPRGAGGGEKRKKGWQLCLRNFNICIENVDVKCCLVELTLVMMSLPLAQVFQCLFTFALVSPWRWLAEIWQLSWQGTTGEVEVEFKFQRRSCKLSFLFSPHHQSTTESLLTGYITSVVNIFMLDDERSSVHWRMRTEHDDNVSPPPPQQI